MEVIALKYMENKKLAMKQEMEKNCCTAPTVVMYNSLDDAGGMGSCESPVQKSQFRYFEN